MTLSNQIEQIQSTTLADVISDRLRKAIITGLLQPGERLSEGTLATQLGVSRSPVREALKRLQSEGLVVGHPNKVCTVWQPSPEDIIEVMSLRVMLETLAIEWALPHFEQEDFTALEAILEESRQAASERDYVNLFRSDKCFHEYICKKSNHNRLLDLWRQIVGLWEVLFFLKMKHDQLEIGDRVIEDHTRILDAFHTRPMPEIISIYKEILQASLDAMLAAAETYPPPSQ